MSKKPLNICLENEDVFRCPICTGTMKMDNLKSLICINNHCFDLSKYGYINMLLKTSKTKYDKQMFISRRTIYKSGFFDPLIEEISQLIIQNTKDKNQPIKILDAGCGEGYHLSSIKEKVLQDSPQDVVAVGIDISKEAVIIAAKEYRGNIWCVADLANCPFASEQFDIILNILSPSNYSEFQRMLADDGIIIKVIPNSNYLQELRTIFYEKTAKEYYSNDDTRELFEKNLDLLDIRSVHYNVPIDYEKLKHLIYMTPLSWGTNQKNIEKVLKSNIDTITIDLAVLIGKKKM